jgi:peptidoglycan LD-endopeptidase LytH
MRSEFAVAIALFAELVLPHPHDRTAAATTSRTPAVATESELTFPVPSVSPDAMHDSFKAKRGKRMHRAVDIMAPRRSEIVAVADGTIAHLADRGAGGIAVYQWSADAKICYFYAHLDGYAPGLSEGMAVRRGDVLGYVGTSGNAREGQWWGGRAVDPYPIWR